jgi:diaminopimelate decarboxylase
MGNIGYKKGRLFIEGVELAKLAEEFGTPLYCYSSQQIADNFNAYKNAFTRAFPKGGFTICYACKANSNQAVLRHLRNLGAGADIVSGGEMARVLKAGIPSSKIVFSGVGKSEAELAEAVKRGLFQINVESRHELAIISRYAQKYKKTVNVAIRVNPNVDAKTHAKITTGKKENKFGIDIALAPALYAEAKRLKGVEACGVAVHIGSQLTDISPFRKAYTRVAALVNTLRKQGHNITRVDLGGGIGITYKDETPVNMDAYAGMVAEVIGPLKVHVVLEPGRSIVGNAGLLLSRVVSVKHGTAKKFLIVDAAMNDLLRPSLYGAYHAVLACKEARATATYDVVGPVCETGDTFLTNEKLPALKDGDLVAIMTSGAYGAAMSSNYNTRPLAAEAIVQGKKAGLARKIQSVDDIIRNDRVPEWLT